MSNQKSTAHTIIAAVCNEHRNSDLRADDRDVLKALDERLNLLTGQREDLIEVLRKAKRFIEEEFEVRKQSFLPDATEDEQGYIGQAECLLKAIADVESRS